ncbi:MAG: amino acid adenylation domain-containing protein, partial [bacterium]|nr:amino acid adenylation domain-containing protein [bacterium]
EELEIEGAVFKPLKIENKISNFDLNLQVYERKNTLYGRLEYCVKLFKKETMERIVRHFVKIMEVAVTKPTVALGKINVLSETEEMQILYEFNDTRADYPADKTIHRLFEEQVERTPDHIAVIDIERFMTYRELNEKCNRMAGLLQSKGVEGENIVAIMAERSMEMLICILAIFKTGCAYLPIEPQYPAARKQFMLEDSCSAILLTTASAPKEITYHEEIINIDEAVRTGIRHIPGGRGEPCARPSAGGHPSSGLAYVIYTSGSTGNPKGAMVEHRGMMNHIWAKITDLQLTSKSIVAQNASHCFDISIWQFLSALPVGGITAVFTGRLVLEPKQFVRRVIALGVTILELVPSYLSVILNTLEPSSLNFYSLAYLLVTGEEIKTNLVEKWFEKFPAIKMVNAYGPTEASDDITHHVMERASYAAQVPIGKTLQNLSIVIVDNDMNLCPVGVKGEICVAGIGVGRGYLNNPELTAEKFVSNPYASTLPKTRYPIPNNKLYRTGDLGRWTEAGVIEFYGRIDFQVKIRGFRIEPGDIENALLKIDTVEQAVVLAIGDNTGNTQLAAYFTGPAVEDELRNFLSKELPDYMIPSYFVPLEKIPLTPNGKIDRKALPEPDVSARISSGYQAPTNEIEEKLVEIWQVVLALEQIGVTDNFFEIGGYSLKAIRMLAKIQESLPGITVRMNDIFMYQTVRQLATYILSVDTKTYKEEEGTASISREILKNENVKPKERPGSRQSAGPVRPGTIEISSLLESHNRELEKQFAAYNRAVLSGGIRQTYNISPVQQGHLSLAKRSSGIIIPIDNAPRIELLQEAVRELVKKQGLLRSVLVTGSSGRQMWREYEAPVALPLPYVDLSSSDGTAGKMTAAELCKEWFLKEIETAAGTGPTLLYRLLLIREKAGELILMVACDHTIYDGMSGEIMRRHIMNYYRSKEKNLDIPGETIHSYREYIEQLDNGPQGIAETDVIAIYELEEYGRYKNRVEEIIRQKTTAGSYVSEMRCQFQMQDGLSEDTAWEYSFALFTRVLSRYFEIPRVPVKIISYGRHYGDKGYFNTVGEFLDFIPILTESTETAESGAKNEAMKMARKIAAYAHKRIGIAARNAINFMGFRYNPLLADAWKRAAQLIYPEGIDVSDQMIMFNFIGKFAAKDMEVMAALAAAPDRNQQTRRKEEAVSTVFCTVTYTPEALDFGISSTLDPGMETFKRLLNEEAQKMGIRKS